MKDKIGTTHQVIEEEAGKDILHNVNEVQTESNVHLEDDKGEGEAVIIRMFEFGANPVAFKEYKPTKQELFNSHQKALEAMLWGDGLTPMPEISPKITINKKKTKYRIFITAKPQRGHLLRERPQTLSEIQQGKPL